MQRSLYLLILASLALPAQQPKVEIKIQDVLVPANFEGQKIGGLLGERMRLNLEGRLLHIEEEALLAGFEKRPGNHPWIGEHIGKYLHAASNTFRFTKNEALGTQMARMALRLMQTQKADGYLGTYTDDQRWTSWDVWVHKYDLIGLLAFYEASGDERALASARRIGDLLWQVFVKDGRDIIASSTHVGMAATSVLEPVCRLYRYTGDKRHLELALHIVKAWEQPNGPKLISSLLSHGNVYRTANGKAYEMMSDLVGLLELYRITGEQDFFDAPKRAQADIVERRRFLTGTTSNHEHFGDDYWLPGEQESDVGEGCATVTWLQLNWHLLRLTGEAKYAAEIERTVFNQLLAAQDPRTGDICYFTAMNGRKVPTRNINCCRSSEPRGISMIPQMVWGRKGVDVMILLYAPGEVDFGDVHIASETDFPESGRIRLTVSPTNPGTRIPLVLRVPEWTRRFTATSSGRVYTGRPGQYLRIDRTWSTRDRVDIDMDMTVTINSGGASYPNQVAIQRGPQLMALNTEVNAEVRYPFRTGLRTVGAGDGRSVPGLTLNGGQVRETELTLAPFSDVREYRIWLFEQGKLPAGPISPTAFGKPIYSSRRADRSGSICDERNDTWSATDRTRAKPEDPDWFGVELREPGRINRVTFVQGPVTVDGGPFDVSKGPPVIEVQRDAKGPWEEVGALQGYEGKEGQVVEVQLAREIAAFAVRVKGFPAGAFTTCAELAAKP